MFEADQKKPARETTTDHPTGSLEEVGSATMVEFVDYVTANTETHVPILDPAAHALTGH